MTKKGLNFSFGLVGITITLLFALIGELYRFHGILLLDLWLPIFTGTWLTHKLLTCNTSHPNLAGKLSHVLPAALLPAALFVAIGFASLLLHSGDMSFGEFMLAAFYGVRWASAVLLAWIVFTLSKKDRSHVIQLLFAFGTALAIGGFIQLQILPVLHETAYELNLGWDPHVGRLFSTWFDPNFVGGFLAFLLPLLIGTALEKPSWRKYLIPSGLIMLAALALTLSRSAYLALLAGLFVFAALRSIKTLATTVLIGSILLFIGYQVSGSIESRINSLLESAAPVFTETYTLPDQSSRLRFDSWRGGLKLFLDKPFIGHGYNRYEEAAIQAKIITDPEKHSASGSDSSLLTILATTGLLGFIPFILTYTLLAIAAWRKRRHAYNAAFLGALTGLAIHSIFVNSLLFPLFMAPFWLAAGLLPPLRFLRKS